MSIDRVSVNNAAGSVPAHSLYGRPAGDFKTISAATSGARPAPPSAPYIGRGNKCVANDDTCNGNRVHGQELCAGHMNALKKRAKKKAELETQAEVEVEESEDGV